MSENLILIAAMFETLHGATPTDWKWRDDEAIQILFFAGYYLSEINRVRVQVKYAFESYRAKSNQGC